LTTLLRQHRCCDCLLRNLNDESSGANRMKQLVCTPIVLSLLFATSPNFILGQHRKASRIRSRCDYKSIGVPTENGSNQKLTGSYDLKRLAEAMKLNRNYEINDHYNGDGLVVSRVFKGVKYNIVLEKRDETTELNLNTYNFKGYPNGTVAWGERCNRRNESIKSNVLRMIEDLPLDSHQKSELKKYVRVTTMTRA